MKKLHCLHQGFSLFNARFVFAGPDSPRPIESGRKSAPEIKLAKPSSDLDTAEFALNEAKAESLRITNSPNEADAKNAKDAISNALTTMGASKEVKNSIIDALKKNPQLNPLAAEVIFAYKNRENPDRVAAMNKLLDAVITNNTKLLSPKAMSEIAGLEKRTKKPTVVVERE